VVEVQKKMASTAEEVADLSLLRKLRKIVVVDWPPSHNGRGIGEFFVFG
jgi:hypothetical protein